MSIKSRCHRAGVEVKCLLYIEIQHFALIRSVTSLAKAAMHDNEINMFCKQILQ